MRTGRRGEDGSIVLVVLAAMIVTMLIFIYPLKAIFGARCRAI